MGARRCAQAKAPLVVGDNGTVRLSDRRGPRSANLCIVHPGINVHYKVVSDEIPY